jgi:hypothetical protein
LLYPVENAAAEGAGGAHLAALVLLEQEAELELSRGTSRQQHQTRLELDNFAAHNLHHARADIGVFRTSRASSPNGRRC